MAEASAISRIHHTWDGTEPSGPNRLLRDGVPSMAGSPKPFPGTTFNDPTYFVTLPLSVLPNSVVSVADTTNFSLLALYAAPFNRLNLPANYLGDQGFSDAPGVFSVDNYLQVAGKNQG